MLIKLPWLKSRKRLLFLSLIDYIFIVIIYFILQSRQIINTNLISVNILAFIWILASYTLDKYSIIDDEHNLNIINKSLRTIKICIISGILFKLIIIIFSILNQM